MKYISKIVSVLLLSLVLFTACNKNDELTQDSQVIVDLNVKGGVPDKIIFSDAKDVDEALKSILSEKADILLNPISAKEVESRGKGKTVNYAVSTRNWSILLNPAPNKAPYQVNNGGNIEFNPFAIKELRYAVNFLIDRSYVVNDILKGEGGISYSPVPLDGPNSWRFQAQVNKLGINQKGDKVKAIKDINTALETAANLPENKDVLIKKSGFWYFNNKILTLKVPVKNSISKEFNDFYDYLSKLLEETGLKVEKISEDKNNIEQLVNNSNPLDLKWNLYMEESNNKLSSAWQDKTIVEYQTSLWGTQPGSGNSALWNYKNLDADNLGAKIITGKIQTETEYWSTLLGINEIATREAVRIFVAHKMDYFATNKKRFNEKLFYGMSTGIDKNSLENANTKDGILNVVEVSGKEGLAKSIWDPIGTKGFEGKASQNITQLVFDDEFCISPFGDTNERRVSVVETKVNPTFQRDASGIVAVSGTISVDKNAEVMDSINKNYKRVPDNLTAAVKTTYKINFGVWHHGREITKADYIYADAFINEWSIQDNSQDKKYDENYAQIWKLLTQFKVASKWNNNGTYTIWSNRVMPTGGFDNIGNIPTLKVLGNPRFNYALPWEIIESIQQIITEGSKSGIKYGLSDSQGTTPIDLKSPEFIKDLKAQLTEFINKKHVPKILEEVVTKEEAVSDYKGVIKFIDDYKHALIGNGSYMLTKLDSSSDYAELTAFRNPKYTEQKGKWPSIFRAIRTNIDKVSIPDEIISGQNVKIVIETSEHYYPYDNTRPTIYSSLELVLTNKDGETRFPLGNDGKGNFVLELNGESSIFFKGPYTLAILGVYDKNITTKVKEIVFK